MARGDSQIDKQQLGRPKRGELPDVEIGQSGIWHSLFTFYHPMLYQFCGSIEVGRIFLVPQLVSVFKYEGSVPPPALPLLFINS